MNCNKPKRNGPITNVMRYLHNNLKPIPIYENERNFKKRNMPMDGCLRSKDRTILM